LKEGFHEGCALCWKEARAKYRTAARGARSQAVKDILNKLAYEEEVHLSVLEDFERDLAKVLAGEKGD